MSPSSPLIAGKTIGTVVDTDQLRIDVTDVVSSGSDAMVALCVTAVISYEGDPDLSKERFKEVSVKASDFALYTTDGTLVKHGEVSVQNGGTDQPDSTYHITVHLEVPANVKDVLSIHIFGNNFDISPVINDAEQK